MVSSRKGGRRTALGPTVWRARRAVNTYVTTLVALLVTTLALPVPGETQPAASDSVTSRPVVPGVSFHRIDSPSGPWVLSLLEVDLRRPELDVRGVRACDRLLGRERPSAIARRLRQEGVNVVGALNADFFDLRGGTGAAVSSVVIDGELVKAVADSPADRSDDARTQFGTTADRRPVIERFSLTGLVRAPSGDWPLVAVNARVQAGLTLLTWWFDSTAVLAAADSSVVSVSMLKTGGRGDTAHYRVDTIPVRRGLTVPTEQTVVLVASGHAISVVERLRPGDRVDVVTKLSPDRGPLRTLVGGWPRIVRAGQNVALEADTVEGTRPGFSQARHPRSALGISRDSTTLYLVVVDGRQERSVGMTLEELANAMIALGAYEAMNFDGGGSTALVVRDSVVNNPSDKSGERPVGNVIVVTRNGGKQPVESRRAVPRSGKAVSSCVLPVRADTASARAQQTQ